MNITKVSKIPVVFATGILLTCLFYSTIVLDYTLVPRFVFLSFFVLFFCLYAFIVLKKDASIKLDFILLPFFLYVIYVCLSILWSKNRSLSIVESSKVLLYLAIFLITYKLVSTRNKEILISIVKSVIILFFISLLKFAIQFFELTNLLHTNLYVITGTSGHKNLYSSFIFLCSVFSLLGIKYLKSGWKIASIISIIIQFVIIIFLQTRAVWLGYITTIVFIILTLVIRRKKSFLYLKQTIIITISFLLFINIFFLFILPKIINIYIEHEPNSYSIEKISDLTTMSERAYVWQKTYEVLQNFKITGAGANNWQIVFPSCSLPPVYRITVLNVTFQRPHNDFLWILTDYGVIGFNLYILFITSIIILLFFVATKNHDYHSIIIFSGICGFLVISFFDFPRERVEHNILFYILLAIAYNRIKQKNDLLRTNFIILSDKSVKLTALILSILICYVSLLNFKGEYYTKKMLDVRIKHDNESIIKYSDKAVSICYNTDPTTVPIRWYSGNAKASLGNFETALKDFKEAYKAHPYNHHVLNDLASAYYVLNEQALSKYYYIKSAKINPRFYDPKLNLTAIYINEGNYKEAEKWLNSVNENSERKQYYKKLIDDKLIK